MMYITLRFIALLYSDTKIHTINNPLHTDEVLIQFHPNSKIYA